MSKSVGNTIVPQEIIKESGAEIIRLWVAMTEFTEELRVSKEILTRVVDFYRKLRNTSRILVANLYDFDPATDMVPVEQMDEVDRYALARYADAAARMLQAYDTYDFSTVSQVLNTMVTVDLSAFYVDVTKDRMYTLGTRSHRRRSTQTAMYIICDGLARLLAPILPVTADDLWRHLPGAHPEPVHLETFPSVDRLKDEALSVRWDALLKVREQVNAALEQKRKDKVIGNSLTAHVTVTRASGVGQLLEQHRADRADAVHRLGPRTERRPGRRGGCHHRRPWTKARGAKCGALLGATVAQASGKTPIGPAWCGPLCGRARRARASVAGPCGPDAYSFAAWPVAGLIVVADQLTLSWSSVASSSSTTAPRVIPNLFSLTGITTPARHSACSDGVDLPFKTGLLASCRWRRWSGW
jgi:hypothetical protein